MGSLNFMQIGDIFGYGMFSYAVVLNIRQAIYDNIGGFQLILLTLLSVAFGVYKLIKREHERKMNNEQLEQKKLETEEMRRKLKK